MVFKRKKKKNKVTKMPPKCHVLKYQAILLPPTRILIFSLVVDKVAGPDWGNLQAVDCNF